MVSLILGFHLFCLLIECLYSIPIYNVTEGEVLYGVEHGLSTSLPTITCCIFDFKPIPSSRSFWFFRNSPVASNQHLGVIHHVILSRAGGGGNSWNYRTIAWPRTLSKDIAGFYKCSRERGSHFFRGFSLVVGGKFRYAV